MQDYSPMFPAEHPAPPLVPEQPHQKPAEPSGVIPVDYPRPRTVLQHTTSQHSAVRKNVEVDPELARSSDSPLAFHAESSSSMRKATSADPEVLYPHLHVLLRMRKMAIAEAYTRKETREILGVSEKTLQRWIDQGRLEIYGLPDVCASAADIEKCLIDCRSRTKKHYQAVEKSGFVPICPSRVPFDHP